MGVYIPNMSKPKKGEVIAFDGECAVYTDDDMQVHRYSLIEIDTTIIKENQTLIIDYPDTDDVQVIRLMDEEGFTRVFVER